MEDLVSGTLYMMDTKCSHIWHWSEWSKKIRV